MQRSLSPEDIARQLPPHQPQMGEAELDSMLTHVLRVPHIRIEALQLLRPEHFDQTIEPHYGLLWAVVKDLYERFPTNVTYEMIATTCSARIQAFPGVMLPADADVLLRSDSAGILWSSMHMPEAELDVAFGEDLLRRFLRERSVIRPVQHIMRQGNGQTYLANFSEVLQAVVDADRRIDTIRQSPVGCLIPARGSVLPSPQEYVPTDIGFIDRYIRGQRVGDSNGILGVFGSGKTTLGGQLAIKNAANFWRIAHETGRRSKLSVFLSYEEPEAKVMARILANAMRIPRDKCEKLDSWDRLSTRDRLEAYERSLPGNTVDGITLSECDRWDQARVFMNESFVLLDMSGSDRYPSAGTGLVDEIVAALERLTRERQTEIGCVVADYAGLMVKRHMEAKSIPEERMRHYLGRLGDQMRRRVAEQFGCTSWLLHQFNAEQNKRNPTTLLHHSDAAEARNFAENLAAVLCLGVRDKITGCLLANWSKLRYTSSDGLAPAVLQIDGRFCEMIDVSHQYTPEAAISGFVDSNTRQQVHGIDRPVPASAGPRGLRRTMSTIDDIGDE